MILFWFFKTEIDILSKLANLYRDFGYYKESEDYYLQILDKNKWFKEEANHVYTSNEAFILEDYALLKQQQGLFSETKQLLSQALVDYEQIVKINSVFYNEKIRELYTCWQ